MSGPLPTPGVIRQATGIVFAACLLLGYVACLALVTSSAGTLGLTGWVAVTAASAALLLAGTGILGMAMNLPRRNPATCPVNAELWRIIDEETRSRRRYDQAS
ncbi:MAG: hypothetical protein ACRD0S_02735 [Acidimicrobiales bacterium]